MDGRTDGRMDLRTEVRMENLPILQDFVPYQGRYPKRNVISNNFSIVSTQRILLVLAIAKSYTNHIKSMILT